MCCVCCVCVERESARARARARARALTGAASEQAPKERARIKMVLAQQEQIFPDLYRYSVYLLYWYKSTNTDAAHPPAASCAKPCFHELTYANVCLRMLTNAHECSCMLPYAPVCSRMLTYAHVCSRMLTYFHACSLMLTCATASCSKRCCHSWQPIAPTRTPSRSASSRHSLYLL